MELKKVKTLFLSICIFVTSMATANEGDPVSIQCKTLALPLKESEPHYGVLKKGEQFFSIINVKNKPSINTRAYAEGLDPYLSIDGKIITPQIHFYTFQRGLIGPFKSLGKATTESCQSYYKSKVNLIKNHYKIKAPKKKNRFEVVLNLGVDKKYLNLTFNQNVTCKSPSIYKLLSSLQKDAQLTYIFSFNGQHWAYMPTFESTQLSHEINYSGPYATAEMASQVACDSLFNQLLLTHNQFTNNSKSIEWHKICRFFNDQTLQATPLSFFKPRLGIFREKKFEVLTLDEVQFLLKTLAIYENSSSDTRLKIANNSKKILLIAEELLSLNDSQYIAQLSKTLQSLLSKIQTQNQQLPVRLDYEKGFWHLDFDLKPNVNLRSIAIPPQLTKYPLVSPTDLGKQKWTSESYVLEKYCQQISQHYGF